MFLKMRLISLLLILGVGVTQGVRLKSIQDAYNCDEAPLEKREEEANVVFTGTVRHLYPDNDHPNQMKAQVEIKRVMKGNNIIRTMPGMGGRQRWQRRLVYVDRIGDPDICDSYARKFDTRIFLTDKGENGELKLKSSLVRLTLNNLDRADAAVKDQPFVPKPTPLESPCEIKYCAFGAECRVNATDNKAYCACVEQCTDVFAPVCGSDQVTYTSECQLRMTSCAEQDRIIVKSQGNCNVRDPCHGKLCSFGAKCVPSLDGLTARCQCRERCDNYGNSVGSQPICGDDGKDYTNQCELERTSCRQMKVIKPKYNGTCDPCMGKECKLGQVCQLDNDRKPVCRCNLMCTEEFMPVCGSDGRTYSNTCQLRMEACKKRIEIQVIFKGNCNKGPNPCSDIVCGPGESCRVNRNGIPSCECPPPCEPVWRPVCGSDSQTYDSQCELQRQACLQKRAVTVHFYGVCSPDGLCTNYQCTNEAICVERDGRAACVCPVCPDNFDPVCGTDGVPYDNECKLRAENCENGKNVRIKHNGLCNGCEQKKCEHYSVCENDGKGNTRCTCPSHCVQVVDKVCGSDGVTYTNECDMRIASCMKQEYVSIASHGDCDLCMNIRCTFGAECRNGQCVCPQDCPHHHEPVCGSDGNTYTNECEMNKQACAQVTEIDVEYRGECDDTSGDGSDFSSGGCDESVCQFGGSCDDMGRCICNFNCDAIRSPVCGTDGKTYGNDCQLREEACKQQQDISALDDDDCELMEELCDGAPVLTNPQTGRPFNCDQGRDVCPAGSYCHRVAGLSRCCSQEEPIKSCQETTYGCCPDNKTPALGNNNAGCPSVCQCNELGSLSRTCDPITRQCTCRPGVGGTQCNRCEPGFWGLPKIREGKSGCLPCGCHIYGSVRDDCNQMTGRCVCKPQIDGQKCNICPNGKNLTSQGCTDPLPSVRSCSEMTCWHGANCVMTNGLAECVCPSMCPSTTLEMQVCGTDGQTYASTCQIRYYACRLQLDIRVAYEAPCSARPTSHTPHRPKKTTRHVTTRRFTQPTMKPLPYGNIGDFCNQDDLGCMAANSYCKVSICACVAGYIPSMDNSQCVEGAATESMTAGSGADEGLAPSIAWATTLPPNPSTGPLGTEAPAPTAQPSPPTTKALSITVPAFSGNSYMELPQIKGASTHTTIDISFRPTQPDGLIMYNGQENDKRGDFIALSMKDGHLEFRYDLGSGTAVLTSIETLQLNTFHHAVAQRQGKESMLQIDGGVHVSGISPGVLQSLNLDQSLYLGSLPNAPEVVINPLGVSTGFHGCIESLRVKTTANQEFNLMYGSSPDVLSAMGLSECGENPCSSAPCQNGGTCHMEDADRFRCDCQPDYSGSICQDFEVGACRPSPCNAGGTCVPLPDDLYFCICPTGRDGDKCEKEGTTDISVPEFRGHSYIAVPLAQTPAITVAYEIWFLTTKPDGVLLYMVEKGDFLSLALSNGYLQLRFNLGSGIANISSSEAVELNKWHQAVITRERKNATLVIDGGTPVTGTSQGASNELNVPQVMYIGGYPGDYHPDVEMNIGLRGAVQKIYDGGLLMDDLLSVATSHRHIHQYAGPPCPSEGNPCLNNGHCMPDLNNYYCICEEGFYGVNCESDMSSVTSGSDVAFNGKTHHRYQNMINRKQRGQRVNEFEVKFSSSSPDGLVVLQHKTEDVIGDYLALVVSGGYPQVSYNLGAEASTDLHTITSDVRVDDGRFHTVTFSRDKRLGTLTVDTTNTVSGVSNHGTTQLDTDGNLWIGGAKNVPAGLPDAYYKGLDGCIQYVMIDRQRLDLVADRLDNDPMEYCDI